MTGLDLETFLSLPRVDLGAWVAFALVSTILAFLAWWSWGSRRALRKCLGLSLAAHLGVVAIGGSSQTLRVGMGLDRAGADQEHLRAIRVQPLTEPVSNEPASTGTASASDLDRAPAALALADAVLRSEPANIFPTADATALASVPPEPTPAPPRGQPDGGASERPVAPPEPRAPARVAQNDAIAPLPPDLAELETAASKPITREPAPRISLLPQDRRLRMEREPAPGPRPNPTAGPPAIGTREQPRGAVDADPPRKEAQALSRPPLEIARTTPRSADLNEAESERPLEARPTPTVPRLYEPRIKADRKTQALRAGASEASERAVERALDWLARHQDDDGRWDGGIARYADGTVANGDDDFTAHCPVGDVCFGECAYWEADAGLTGLALLAYLGAGHTQLEGRHSGTVGRGLDFLIRQQKPDGDLRGPSRAVGMYCHAMATLALCEAYALTAEPRLRTPVERAVDFMVKARAQDGLGWRYSPGATVGDTSILGWIVMALKSARETGVPIAGEASARAGSLGWLEKVAAGDHKGLARYQPGEPVTPTMTAEAWVCRQFLGQGGTGPASDEAAAYLLEHESDRGRTNVYYWYYATLALFQHGGESWTRWNALIRDRLVGLQRTAGHQTGSWDPDSSLYGAKCGRIYCTTLAVLTLEVYYRYLRLYAEPGGASNGGPSLEPDVNPSANRPPRSG